MSKKKNFKTLVFETAEKGTVKKEIYISSDDSCKKKPAHFLLRLTPLVLIIGLVVIFLIITSNSFSTEIIIEQVNKTGMTEVNTTELERISFHDYTRDLFLFEGKEASLKGFLKRYVSSDEKAGAFAESTTYSGVYIEVITDDYKREINLIVNSSLRAIFPHKGITEELYLVNGTFVKDFNVMSIKVTSIIISERDIIMGKENRTMHYTEDIEKEIQMPNFPRIRAFVMSFSKRFGSTR